MRKPLSKKTNVAVFVLMLVAIFAFLIILAFWSNCTLPSYTHRCVNQTMTMHWPCRVSYEEVSENVLHAYLNKNPPRAIFPSHVLFAQLKQSNLLSFAEQQPAERAQSWRWSGAYVVTAALCCLGCCCLTPLNSVSDIVTNHCAMCAVSIPDVSLPEIAFNYHSILLACGWQCKGAVTMTWDNKVTTDWVWMSVADSICCRMNYS